jgi:hypothetical protein
MENVDEQGPDGGLGALSLCEQQPENAGRSKTRGSVALVRWCRSARWWLAGSLLVCSSLACSGNAPRMRAAADWDRSADLSPTKTFNVTRSKLLPPNLTPEQNSWVSIIEAATKRELVRKGYVEAPADTAELIATSHFMARERLGVSTYTCENYWRYEMYEGAVLPAGAVPPCQESAIASYEEGTLMIDVYDTRSKELVWHGWASAPRPQPGSKDTPALVEQATVDILDHFPP